ncbi:MAG: hypothetical protein IT572_07485 [Deltaproteobacteria bacterium]|nr:hypothetical protein [Deltaproteobacteria bacterium]
MDNSFKAPPPPKSIQSGEEYLSDNYGLETEDYGEYEDFGLEVETAPAGAVADRDIYQEIDKLTGLARSQGANPEVLKALEEKRRLALQSASFSPERREALRESLRIELGELEGRILMDIEQAPARESLKKELQELRGELQSEVQDEDAKEDISELIGDAETALKNKDLEAAQEKLEEAKADLDAAVSEAKAEKEEAEAERNADFKVLKDKIKDSELSDAKKEELQTKLDALETDSKQKNVDTEKLRDDIEALKKEISKEIKMAGMRKSFLGFPSKIPPFEYAQITAGIATAFQKGIENGDWSEFMAWLQHPETSQDCKYHAIRQIVGTIYYALAGMDEAKLEEFLDLIPKDVRQAMINVIMPTYANNNHWSSNEGDRSARYLYGNYGKEVAARLEQSMQAEDIKGDADGSSGS